MYNCVKLSINGRLYAVLSCIGAAEWLRDALQRDDSGDTIRIDWAYIEGIGF